MTRCPNQNIQDESDYLDYFWWKEYYTVNNVIQGKERAFCNLCGKLNEQKTWNEQKVSGEENRKYQDFNLWFQKDQCVQASW